MRRVRVVDEEYVLLINGHLHDVHVGGSRRAVNASRLPWWWIQEKKRQDVVRANGCAFCFPQKKNSVRSLPIPVFLLSVDYRVTVIVCRERNTRELEGADLNDQLQHRVLHLNKSFVVYCSSWLPALNILKLCNMFEGIAVCSVGDGRLSCAFLDRCLE